MTNIVTKESHLGGSYFRLFRLIQKRLDRCQHDRRAVSCREGIRGHTAKETRMRSAELWLYLTAETGWTSQAFRMKIDGAANGCSPSQRWEGFWIRNRPSPSQAPLTSWAFLGSLYMAPFLYSWQSKRCHQPALCPLAVSSKSQALCCRVWKKHLQKYDTPGDHRWQLCSLRYFMILLFTTSGFRGEEKSKPMFHMLGRSL